MKIATYILLIITLVLGVVAVALWLQPDPETKRNSGEARYGLYEGLELVGYAGRNGSMTYAVVDADGRKLFNIPLRNCIIDEHYRQGRLHFRENGTGREGYIDRQGIVTFLYDGNGTAVKSENQNTSMPEQAMQVQSMPVANKETKNSIAQEADLRSITRSNPFYKEAMKVLSGGLSEDDAHKRRVILNYCEHLRTAYTTKDIDFLRQVFSEKALIIVGNVVKTKAENDAGYLPQERVAYNIHSKKEYIARLGKVFAANKKVDIKFTDFRIMRHPTINGIYGVSLRQQYKSDRYNDDGFLFLLWDFRNESMPMIHVRTWQAAASVTDGNEVISIRDFNFE